MPEMDAIQLDRRRRRTSLCLQMVACGAFLLIAYSLVLLRRGFGFGVQYNLLFVTNILSAYGTTLTPLALLMFFSFRLRKGHFGSLAASLAICSAMMVQSLLVFLPVARLTRFTDFGIQSLWSGLFLFGMIVSLRQYLSEYQQYPTERQAQAALAAQRRAGIGLLASSLLLLVPAILLIGLIVFQLPHETAKAVSIVAIAITAGFVAIAITLLVFGLQLRATHKISTAGPLLLGIMIFFAVAAFNRWTISFFIRRIPAATLIMLGMPIWIIAELLHARWQERFDRHIASAGGFEVQTVSQSPLRVEPIQNESERLGK
jgi:hypothetical protein